MTARFSFCDLLPFGNMTDGALCVTGDFSLSPERDGSGQPMTVTTLARFEGGSAPTVYAELLFEGQAFYRTPAYTLGDPGEYRRRQFRVPPAFDPRISIVLRVTVPEGTTLFLRDFGNGYDAAFPHWDGGLRHNAHLGFYDLAPENTLPAVELAAACGFPACIVVPKVTKDGEIVCLHDEALNRTARNPDGSELTGEIRVQDLTYEELLRYDFGLYKSPLYRGTKIPLLDEVFAVCSRTGMRPMFSTHPPLSVPAWKKVGDLLEKHGLLRQFHIKSFSDDTLTTAWSVFGTSIEGYTFDNRSFEGFSPRGIDTKSCRVGIEVRRDNMTEEVAKAIRSLGCFASIWKVGRIDAAEYRRYIGWGVTEFTEDCHCSMGLNW